MTDELRDYAAQLMLDHARDVEHLTITEMAPDHLGRDLTDDEITAVADLIATAHITITQPARPRVFFNGDEVPAGVRVIAEDGEVYPDADDMEMEWVNGNLGPLVELIVDYDTEVARARRDREGVAS